MAGLGRRTFQAGEVLTASNVMAYLQDQVVQNYAGTAARGSAIGTAVSEGMVSYLADSNTVQAYDGSAWNSLAYASAVPTLAQTGLRTVIPTGVTVSGGSGSYNSTTGLVTFTAVNTVTVEGVFSSSYANYRIVYEGTNTNDVGVGIRMDNVSTGIYYWQWARMYGSTVQGLNSTSGTSFYVVSGDSDGYSGATDIISPNKAVKTSVIFQGWGSGPADFVYTGSGQIQSTTQHTGFTLVPVNGTTTGTVKVYGYN